MAAPVYHGDLYQFSHVRMDRVRQKSLLVGYLLWFFAGMTGAHRYYMGRITSGLIQSCMLIAAFLVIFASPTLAAVIFGLLSLWVLIDAVLIPLME